MAAVVCQASIEDNLSVPENMHQIDTCYHGYQKCAYFGMN